jgi:uncharacterized phiE125 gp8 family phage protein
MNLVEIDGATRAHLSSLSEAAQAAIFAHTGDFSDADPAEAPADVRMAILLLAAHWYANRETAAVDHLTAIPWGVTELISPYRERAF